MLDYIVSEGWLFMTVFIALCAVPTLMIMKRPFKNLFLARTTQIVVSLLAFAALMYMVMGPSGYAVQFVGGLSNGKDLCLIEMHFEGEDGYEAYRLYVLDQETGNLKFRKKIETQDILCVRENSVVFFLWNYAEEYDLTSGELLHTWSEEEGFEKFPQLDCGISDLNRGSNSAWFENFGWLSITAKDGHKYCYDIMKDELIETEYLNGPPERGEFTCDEYSVKFKDSTDGTSWYYDFQDKTGEIKQLVFHDSQDKETVLEGEYLNPDMVDVYPKIQTFVLRHYTTTESISSIHSAVGSDNKIKWQLSQADLKTEDKFSKQPLPGISMPVDNNLILTFGGQVFCIRVASGKVLWKTAL